MLHDGFACRTAVPLPVLAAAPESTIMTNKPDRRIYREVQFSGALWDSFEELSQTLHCSVDHLLGEAMRLYLRAYQIANAPGAQPSARDAPGKSPPEPSHAAPVPPPPAPRPDTPRGTAKAHRPTLRDDQNVRAVDAARVATAPAADDARDSTQPEMQAVRDVLPHVALPRGAPAGDVPLNPTQLEIPVVSLPDPPPNAPAMPVTAPLPVVPVGHISRAPAPAVTPKLEIPPQEIVIRAQKRASIPPPAPTPSVLPQVPTPEVPRVRAALWVICDGREHRVEKDEYVIGRGQRICDLVIPDTKVSRQHARVVRRGAEYWLLDENSGAGVEFNGTSVREKRIDFGDRFTICGHELRFEYR